MNNERKLPDKVYISNYFFPDLIKFEDELKAIRSTFGNTYFLMPLPPIGPPIVPKSIKSYIIRILQDTHLSMLRGGGIRIIT